MFWDLNTQPVKEYSISFPMTPTFWKLNCNFWRYKKNMLYICLISLNKSGRHKVPLIVMLHINKVLLLWFLKCHLLQTWCDDLYENNIMNLILTRPDHFGVRFLSNPLSPPLAHGVWFRFSHYIARYSTWSVFLQSAIRRLFPVNTCVETGLLHYYPSNLYPVNSPTFSWRISGDYPSNGGECACRNGTPELPV